MKPLLLFLFFIVVLSTSAQNATPVEQYCELVAQGRLLSRKVTIDVDFGQERKLFSGDTRMKDEISGKVKKFNSLVDALNYMGAEGWSLVNAFPLTEGSGPMVYHFYFKKLFTKEEALKDEK